MQALEETSEQPCCIVLGSVDYLFQRTSRSHEEVESYKEATVVFGGRPPRPDHPSQTKLYVSLTSSALLRPHLGDIQEAGASSHDLLRGPKAASTTPNVVQTRTRSALNTRTLRHGIHGVCFAIMGLVRHGLPGR